MFSGTIFRRNEENFKNIFEGRFSAVNNDPRRYDNDDLYKEDTGHEDEYDTDAYDYIVDDEDEDENALWDDEEAPTEADDDSDEPPIRKRRK